MPLNQCWRRLDIIVQKQNNVPLGMPNAVVPRARQAGKLNAVQLNLRSMVRQKLFSGVRMLARLINNYYFQQGCNCLKPQ